MHFEIDTKFSVGDTVYCVMSKQQIITCADCGCTKSVRKDFKVVKVKISKVFIDATDSYCLDLTEPGFGVMYSFEPDSSLMVDEWKLFATKKEAEKNLDCEDIMIYD